MTVTATPIDGVLILEPKVFSDARGRFLETWSGPRYDEAGVPGPFVQDNVSVSRRGVVRGLHFQRPNPQGKLVGVFHGAVYDVAVDVRPGSPTFGRWVSAELTAESGRQLWVPEGLAHGFQALEEGTVLYYKCTGPYSPADEWAVRWDDPELGIEWPLADPVVSAKDAAAPSLRDLASHWAPMSGEVRDQ